MDTGVLNRVVWNLLTSRDDAMGDEVIERSRYISEEWALLWKSARVRGGIAAFAMDISKPSKRRQKCPSEMTTGGEVWFEYDSMGKSEEGPLETKSRYRCICVRARQTGRASASSV